MKDGLTIAKRPVAGGNNPVFTGKTGGCSLLEKFVPQEKIEKEKKLDVKMNPALKKLDDAFANLLKEEFWHLRNDEEKYARALASLKWMRCTVQDVELFSLGLYRHKGKGDFACWSGMFLSAMVNRAKGEKFTIHTERIEDKINYLGYRNNGKKILINGDAGSHVGYRMKKGSIMVKGNAEDSTGHWMAGGRIIVEGNVGDTAGFLMENGSITVKGDAGGSLGQQMIAGSINVRGNAVHLVGYRMGGGKIRIKGDAGHIMGLDMKEGTIVVWGRIGGIDETPGGEIWQGTRLISKDGKLVGKLNEGF
ncbi:Molybdenum-containing formylmethanofuran dehydrogenase 1 subunit C [uncultured archaeon]|nr:Molybdenum-containing formylmethanofuran dehydrogenase 1 subunit C [uncultured archaeon]